MNGEQKNEYQTTDDLNKSGEMSDLEIPIDKAILSHGYGYGDD